MKADLTLSQSNAQKTKMNKRKHPFPSSPGVSLQVPLLHSGRHLWWLITHILYIKIPVSYLEFVTRSLV